MVEASGDTRGAKIPADGPGVSGEEGRETSTDPVLINRDGSTRSHSGVVSGGNQSEEGLSSKTEHGPDDVTSSNSVSASRGCLDEGFTRSVHSGCQNEEDVLSEVEQGPMDVQKECRPMQGSGSGVEAFTHAESVRCEMLPDQPSLSSSTDSPISPACLNAQHAVIDTHRSELSLHSSEGYDTSKANIVGGMDLSLLHCEGKPSLLSTGSTNSLRMFDVPSFQEGRMGQDSGLGTICGSRVGRQLQPEEMESPRLLCRIGLSKLSLGGNESETQTDQPDKPVVIGRKRRRGCRTSQRTSGRISKHAKREVDQELDSEQPIPTEAVLTRTDTTHLGASGMFSSKPAGMYDLSEEVDCPIPSTPQQKEARRLARLRQLRDMRARETMEARRERALKRRGEPSPTKQKPDSSAKRVSWKEDGFLTKVMEY